MAAVAKVDELLRLVDCALVHPPVPSASAGPHRRRPMAELRGPADVTELYPIVFDLYKTVDASHAFREPVNAFEFNILDYYHRIKAPMCLRTVLDRIADPSGAYYSGRAQVLAEVATIWRNCEAYNGELSQITEAGRQCEGWLAGRLQSLEDGRIAGNDEVDAFNDLFMAEAERDHDAAEGLMAFVRRLNPRLLTNDGDLDLEKLTAGELRQMHRFLEDHAAGKRPRE